MRSLPNILLEINVFNSSSAREIDLAIVSPHQFAIEHQRQLLPNWDNSLSYLILVLQQSSLSLQESTAAVAREKEQLRAEFIRLGSGLIFALQDQGFSSDLFDPRTGYPLLAAQNMAWDDNAAVKAILNYPLVSYQQCSLIAHPIWGHHVYPATVATTATLPMLESCLKQTIIKQNWRFKS